MRVQGRAGSFPLSSSGSVPHFRILIPFRRVSISPAHAKMRPLNVLLKVHVGRVENELKSVRPTGIVTIAIQTIALPTLPVTLRRRSLWRHLGGVAADGNKGGRVSRT